MHETINNFNKQFLFEPKIVNQENLVRKNAFIIVGMGGSVHAPKLLKNIKPDFNIIIHQDYGLPKISLTEKKNRLIILSSYSGNTEEVIKAFKQAKKENLAIAVISVGGKLLSLAKKNNTPYIALPETGIQPRSALGFSIKAFLKLINEEELKKVNVLTKNLNPSIFEKSGKDLSKKIKNYIPVIYSSNKNSSLAELWKIKFNENSKIPAFYNILPELNHNEMTGFDIKDSTLKLGNKFYFIILKDEADDPKIIKRIKILEKLYTNRNLQVVVINLKEKDPWLKYFSSLILADWTTYYTALEYGQDPISIPMIEEFKKLISL